MNVIKELAMLYVKDNNYLIYQRRFCYLVAHHKELVDDHDDFYHDMFLNSLRDYQKVFVKTKLDDFFATGQDSISNIDIDDLMKQLMNCMSKMKDTERLKPQ
ncbi:hypothetical protein GX50_08954 [[Emmonsia] crescens]|uniref:Uncharacterized protein n=1 Tax=[Emmonsia] crescens TaxID=73230 RepID=A0A2B7Z4Y8_9EURO|nr:hypothetical protein GX50_08954 [Emmonsia crescens]